MARHFLIWIACCRRQEMVGGGGGVKTIPPTMFSGKVEIPDLRYCFHRDTVKMVMLRFLPNLPIVP
jgi:hypothetical protein